MPQPQLYLETKPLRISRRGLFGHRQNQVTLLVEGFADKGNWTVKAYLMNPDKTLAKRLKLIGAMQMFGYPNPGQIHQQARQWITSAASSAGFGLDHFGAFGSIDPAFCIRFQADLTRR